MQDITAEGIVSAIGIGLSGAFLFGFGRWLAAQNILREPYSKKWVIFSTVSRLVLIGICFLSFYEYVPQPRWFHIGLTFVSFELGVWMVLRYFKRHPRGPEPTPQ